MWWAGGALPEIRIPRRTRRLCQTCPVTPAQVVQGVFDGLAEGLVHATREEAVETGAFVDFVEIRNRFSVANDVACGVSCRRAVAVVEGALDQIGGGQQVLQSLLILDADGLGTDSSARRTAAI